MPAAVSSANVREVGYLATIPEDTLFNDTVASVHAQTRAAYGVEELLPARESILLTASVRKDLEGLGILRAAGHAETPPSSTEEMVEQTVAFTIAQTRVVYAINTDSDTRAVIRACERDDAETVRWVRWIQETYTPTDAAAAENLQVAIDAVGRALVDNPDVARRICGAFGITIDDIRASSSEYLAGMDGTDALSRALVWK